MLQVGDHSIAPAADFVAEDPKPARPSRPDSSFGDDTPLPPAAVRDRCHLDRIETTGYADLQGGVVHVATRPALDRRADGLVDDAVEVDGVVARSQWDPVEINRRAHSDLAAGADGCWHP